MQCRNVEFLGNWHNEEQVGSDEIHALAVSHVRITTRIRQQYFVQLRDSGTLAKEDVVRQRAVDVHLDLRHHDRVIFLLSTRLTALPPFLLFKSKWRAKGLPCC